MQKREKPVSILSVACLKHPECLFGLIYDSTNKSKTHTLINIRIIVLLIAMNGGAETGRDNVFVKICLDYGTREAYVVQ